MIRKPKQRTELQQHGDKLAAVKARIAPLVDAWLEPLGLDRWRRVTFHYHAERWDEEAAGSSTGARACIMWEYIEADIHFYLPALLDQSDSELEYITVHEFCHALVREMRWEDTRPGESSADTNGRNMNHEERVVTALAMCFLRVRKMALEGLLA